MCWILIQLLTSSLIIGKQLYISSLPFPPFIKWSNNSFHHLKMHDVKSLAQWLAQFMVTGKILPFPPLTPCSDCKSHLLILFWKPSPEGVSSFAHEALQCLANNTTRMFDFPIYCSGFHLKVQHSSLSEKKFILCLILLFLMNQWASQLSLFQVLWPQKLLFFFFLSQVFVLLSLGDRQGPFLSRVCWGDNSGVCP